MSFYMKWFGSCTIQRSLRINWIVTTAKCEMFPRNRMTQEKLKWWKKWWKWCLLGLQKVILVSDCSHEIRRWLLLGRNVMTVSLLCAKHFLNTLYYFHSLELGIQFSSVQLLSRVRLFATPWTAARQAFLSITNPGVHTNPCPLSQRCHPTISSSVILFSSCPQSFSASGSFQMSQLFASWGQSIGVSVSTSALPKNTQDWSPLGWTGCISLQPRDSQESSPTS